MDMVGSVISSRVLWQNCVLLLLDARSTANNWWKIEKEHSSLSLRRKK